jgi:osmotically-inducible protein OsmY
MSTRHPPGRRPTDKITVSKPAIGGGETPATAATHEDESSTGRAAPPEAGTSAAPTSGNVTAADNTAVNRRDTTPNALLPTDQGNNQRDLDITAEIRQRILRNSGMSIKGQNVKVITTGGKVTLRGPVASDAERKLIEQIARDVAGPDHMASDLEVAP